MAKNKFKVCVWGLLKAINTKKFLPRPTMVGDSSLHFINFLVPPPHFEIGVVGPVESCKVPSLWNISNNNNNNNIKKEYKIMMV